MFPLVYTDDEGQEWECHTDFRQWVRVEALMLDKDIPESLKTDIALKIIFPVVPNDKSQAISFISEFFKCGVVDTQSKNNTKSQKQAYSFNADYGYIYAAFLEMYNIDLQDINYLHFWKYKYMFNALHDCKLIEIIGYRVTETDSKTPQCTKDHVKKMKSLYKLPLYLSEQQILKKIKERRGEIG